MKISHLPFYGSVVAALSAVVLAPAGFASPNLQVEEVDGFERANLQVFDNTITLNEVLDASGDRSTAVQAMYMKRASGEANPTQTSDERQRNFGRLRR